MTCDTGLTLGYILWPLSFPPPANSGRSHTRVDESGREALRDSGQVTTQNTTCPKRSDGGVWRKVRERVAVCRCSLLTSLRAVPTILTPETVFSEED